MANRSVRKSTCRSFTCATWQDHKCRTKSHRSALISEVYLTVCTYRMMCTYIRSVFNDVHHLSQPRQKHAVGTRASAPAASSRCMSSCARGHRAGATDPPSASSVLQWVVSKVGAAENPASSALRSAHFQQTRHELQNGKPNPCAAACAPSASPATASLKSIRVTLVPWKKSLPNPIAGTMPGNYQMPTNQGNFRVNYCHALRMD